MFSTMSEKLLIQRMKEEMCYIAEDFETASAGFQDQAEFRLPDGSGIRLSQNRIRCPQVLFEPGLHAPYDEYRGVHSLVHKCLQDCEIDTHKDLLANVVPVGGSTLFRNFRPALKRALQPLLPPKLRAEVVDVEDLVTCAWHGGAVLSSLGTFESQWVTRADYDEHGPGIVHRTCLAA